MRRIMMAVIVGALGTAAAVVGAQGQNLQDTLGRVLQGYIQGGDPRQDPRAQYDPRSPQDPSRRQWDERRDYHDRGAEERLRALDEADRRLDAQQRQIDADRRQIEAERRRLTR
jgi:hypothetical protein